MDEYTPSTPSVPPAKVKKGHIVLFVLSCVFLVLSLMLVDDLAEVIQVFTSADPPADATGMGWIGVFLGEALKGFTLGLLLFLLAVYGGAGLVMSVILAVRKNNKPLWMWIASLVLTLAFLAVLVAVILLLC